MILGAPMCNFISSAFSFLDKMTRGVRRGCVRLRGALIGIDDEVKTFFDAQGPHQEF